MPVGINHIIKLWYFADWWNSPILTYSKRGTTKAGVDPTTHAIIYTPDPGPGRLSEETGMTKKPIRVNPVTPSQTLDPLSRVNFARVYTVDHNVRIMPVGQVAEDSMHRLVAYWLNEMTRQKWRELVIAICPPSVIIPCHQICNFHIYCRGKQRGRWLGNPGKRETLKVDAMLRELS